MGKIRTGYEVLHRLPANIELLVLNILSVVDLIKFGEALKIWTLSGSKELPTYCFASQLREATGRHCLIVEGTALASCEELFGPCRTVNAEPNEGQKRDVCVLKAEIKCNDGDAIDEHPLTWYIWLPKDDLKKFMLSLHPYLVTLKLCEDGHEQTVREVSWLDFVTSGTVEQPQKLYRGLADQLPDSNDHCELETYFKTFYWLLDPVRFERRRCLRMRDFIEIFERLWDAGDACHDHLLSLLLRIVNIWPEDGFLGFLDELKIVEDDMERLRALTQKIQDTISNKVTKREGIMVYWQHWCLLWYGYHELALRKHKTDLGLRPILGKDLYTPSFREDAFTYQQEMLVADRNCFFEDLSELVEKQIGDVNGDVQLQYTVVMALIRMNHSSYEALYFRCWHGRGYKISESILHDRDDSEVEGAIPHFLKGKKPMLG